MPPATDLPEKSTPLPPPWDRIFSLATRTFVWALLIGILWLLQPFFLLIFLTFVFAYIQAHGVDGLAHRIKNRPLRVTIVGLVFLGTLLATGFTLFPQVKEQADQFWLQKDKHIADADQRLNTFLRQYPGAYEGLLKRSEVLRELNTPETPDGAGTTQRREAQAIRDFLSNVGRSVNDALRELERTEPRENDAPTRSDGQPPKATQQRELHAVREFLTNVAKSVTDSLRDLDQRNAAEVGTAQPPEVREPQPATQQRELHAIRDFLSNVAKSLTENPIALGQSVLGYVSSFLLSLLFSFLIVLDLQKLQRSIQGLSRTKIGFIYDEVADNIAGFGRVLGRALEAQLFIAVVNTILTAIGVWVLGLPNMLVLSTIVFFCSFIPVVGTFISSTPICLLALQSPGGVTTMLLAILLICVIHAIETYILNPQIYGHHMHMNPVLVLIVLTIGGKLFGVWGLVLGIPIVNYFFRHAIRHPEERPVEN